MSMDRLILIGKLAATIGGGAWVVKSGLIIILNDHFQPIEGVLYFIGVGGILLGALGLAAFFASGKAGVSRWLIFLVVLAVAVVVTAVASSYVQETVADSYDGGNVGVEEEMGILTPGIIWLAVGLYLTGASRPERVG